MEPGQMTLPHNINANRHVPPVGILHTPMLRTVSLTVVGPPALINNIVGQSDAATVHTVWKNTVCIRTLTRMGYVIPVPMP